MKHLIYVAILLVTLQSYAQNDLVRYRPCNAGCTSNPDGKDPINGQFEYGVIISFETPDVVSDYGVRNAGKGATKFHQAIDYSPLQNHKDKGFALVAVKAGNVNSISAIKNYKYITVGKYRYGHIFSNGRESGKVYKSGKFILQQVEKIDEPTLDDVPWAIIDLEYCRAFCAESGRTVTVDDLPSSFCGSKTFTTINYVEEGWDIAPMGNSGGNFETHLHLERRENDTKHDPNQNVQHQSQDFEVALTTKDNTDVQLKYPGTSRNSLRLRATMSGGIALNRGNFENVTMNLDKADILLQRDVSNDYEHIVGFEGSKKAKIESRFWLGANHNITIYPSNWNARDFGSWTQTGTYPYAHNDANNQIYDDYFFADFYTRIHKDKHDVFTDVPANARYNDGKYKLKPTVTNVRDELFTIPGIDLTLDNYLPYLTSAHVRYDNVPVYQAERVSSEGDIKVANDGTISSMPFQYASDYIANGTHTMTIEIKTNLRPNLNIYMSVVGDNINIMLAASGFNFKRMMNKWKSSFWRFLQKLFYSLFSFVFIQKQTKLAF